MLLGKLTNREKEIAELITQCYSDKQIMNKLFIAKSTYKTYLSNLYEKFGIYDPNEKEHSVKRLRLAFAFLDYKQNI